MCGGIHSEHVNIHQYLFLVVFDGQFELCQVVTLPGVQFLALVVSVVQYGFQLSGTPGLVQEVFGKALALLRQLLVLLSELILHLRSKRDALIVSNCEGLERLERGSKDGRLYLTELFEFPTQPERREDGILAGQRDERRGGQGFVDVEPGARVSQTVHLSKQRENLSHLTNIKTIKEKNPEITDL